MGFKIEVINKIGNEKLKNICLKAYEHGYLDGYDFAIAVQELFIDCPIIDTGNWENVNAELLLRLAEKAHYHPMAYAKFKH